MSLKKFNISGAFLKDGRTDRCTDMQIERQRERERERDIYIYRERETKNRAPILCSLNPQQVQQIPTTSSKDLIYTKKGSDHGGSPRSKSVGLNP